MGDSNRGVADLDNEAAANLSIVGRDRFVHLPSTAVRRSKGGRNPLGPELAVVLLGVMVSSWGSRGDSLTDGMRVERSVVDGTLCWGIRGSSALEIGDPLPATGSSDASSSLLSMMVSSMEGSKSTDTGINMWKRT